MILAVAAALAAFLTFMAFVAPAAIGSAFVLVIAAIALRIVALVLLRAKVAGHGDPTVHRGLAVLLVGEALFLTATILSIPVDLHFEGAAFAGWLSLILWIVYGGSGVYGGLKLIPVVGWVRYGGILIAAAAGFWFTQIGLIVWPFAMAAGYLCFAVAGIRNTASAPA